MVEVKEATSSEVTLTLLEPTTDDEDVMVVLKSEAVLYVGITFSFFDAVSKNVSLISAAEVEEGTSSGVTAGSDKLLEVATVEEIDKTELVSVVAKVEDGIDVRLLVACISPVVDVTTEVSGEDGEMIRVVCACVLSSFNGSDAVVMSGASKVDIATAVVVVISLSVDITDCVVAAAEN